MPFLQNPFRLFPKRVFPGPMHSAVQGRSCELSVRKS